MRDDVALLRVAPDRFYGGVIGALIAAVVAAPRSGYLLPAPRV
jgi:hypothetical protein